jgi:fructose-specific phosphotransferase system IIA component
MNHKRLWIKPVFLILFFAFPAVIRADLSGGTNTVIHQMQSLVLQLGVILFAARGMAILFEKMKLPGVMGELVTGILIGPYLLGGIPLPGFDHGLFGTYLHINPGAGIPVSPELYGIATIASVLLLFMVGLETNFALLLRLSATGLIVGVSGVLFSFFVGAAAGIWLLNLPLMHPVTLFLGVISTATSVGITGRILTERKKMDSPEGVTILAAAVIDDVLGIILLTVVLAMSSALLSDKEAINWGNILFIGGKAIGVWLIFTALGLIFARRISAFLKIFKGIKVPAVMAFGLALLLAGIFEKAGLAMIIGAYVMGLSLSKTDLNYVIQESLKSIYLFAVPVFFVVSGMMVNLRVFLSGKILLLGLIYTAGAILAKVLGCGVPLLFRRFNLTGAIRVGLGMVPRGEVALIIAGIGLGAGFLNADVFGMIIFMTLVTTLIAPSLLNISLKNDKRGTTLELLPAESVVTEFPLPTPETVEFVAAKNLQLFRDEGFFINQMELDYKHYQIRKNDIFITMICRPDGIFFETSHEDTSYVKTLMYESFVELHEVVQKMKDITRPESLKSGFTEGEDDKRINLKRVLDPGCIRLNLKETNKKGVIEELVDILDSQYQIMNRQAVFQAVWEREQSFSTGMKNGLAIPHARTDQVESITLAVGIHRKGVDFDSLDGELSRVFVLLLSPKHKTVPHIQILSHIAAIMSKDNAVQSLLSCKTPQAVYKYLTETDNP